jgi:hypothetical protein
METTNKSVILLDTDAISNYLNDSNSQFTKKINDFKKSEGSMLLVTYLTWYELFKSLKNEGMIVKKLKLLASKTDGYILHDDINPSIETYLEPRAWLEHVPFPTKDFLKFIKNLEDTVMSKITPHILDSFYVTIYTLLLFDHLEDYENSNKVEQLKLYIPILQTLRNEFDLAVTEIFKQKTISKNWYIEALYTIYNEVRKTDSGYNESLTDFSKRIRKFKHTDLLIKLRQINNVSKSKVIYDLTNKETLFDDIYDHFYIRKEDDTNFQKCKKFIFKNNPLYGGKFELNDYIDMSNFLLSTKTPSVKIHYYTDDIKWQIFIKSLNDELLLNLE